MNGMRLLYQSLLIAALLFAGTAAHAQHILNKVVGISVNRQPLAGVLEEIGRKGQFYFSYNSDIINAGTPVTLTARKTVRELLDQLLGSGYEYRESGNYLILQRSREKFFMLTGCVSDKTTGRTISNASVYESNQLVSTLTNDQGYFRLRLRDKSPQVTLAVSKEFYTDTILLLHAGNDQDLSIAISPVPQNELAPVVVTRFVQVERTRFGKFFLSSRQKIQSLNLKHFFASKPFQFSLTPGLSSRSNLGAQVVNKLSFNILGGYTAGVNGLELAGIFNIDKKNVQYVQIAGVFNVVGGKVTGVQLAGIHNHVLDTLKGLQASGYSNLVKKSLQGVQLAGGYNLVSGNMEGVQAAGSVNIVKYNVQGVQLGAVGNIARHEVKGVQAGSIFNYAGLLKGVQVGLINIADSSSGYSIGLVNIVRKGYHKLVVSTNEVLNVNLAYKSGNRKLYSILSAGVNISATQKAFSVGYGIGREFRLSAATALTTELTQHTLYLGDWKHIRTLYRIEPAFHYRLSKKISIFTGPVFSMCYPGKEEISVKNYKSILPAAGYHQFNIGRNLSGWIGWHAGISFF
jgi:uncharacterized lipoprotein YajG